MTFLITWQLHEGKLHETLSRFAHMTDEQEQAMLGDKVKLVGRWHDLIRGEGVAICEADSVEEISAYALKWNDVMDLDIAAVTDDAGARKLGKQLG